MVFILLFYVSFLRVYLVYDFNNNNNNNNNNKWTARTGLESGGHDSPQFSLKGVTSPQYLECRRLVLGRGLTALPHSRPCISALEPQQRPLQDEFLATPIPLALSSSKDFQAKD